MRIYRRIKLKENFFYYFVITKVIVKPIVNGFIVINGLIITSITFVIDALLIAIVIIAATFIRQYYLIREGATIISTHITGVAGCDGQINFAIKKYLFLNL